MERLNRATGEFFTGFLKNKLMLQYCSHCQRHIFYLRSYCPGCLGELKMVEAQGTGKIVTFTVVHKNPFDPLFDQMTPYIAALIELDEGVYMYGQIVTRNREAIKINQRVKAVFIDEKVGPVFQPIEKGQ